MPLDMKIPRGKQLEGCYKKQNKTPYTENVKISLNQVPKLKKKSQKRERQKPNFGKVNT